MNMSVGSTRALGGKESGETWHGGDDTPDLGKVATSVLPGENFKAEMTTADPKVLVW